jgi:hypothetical protein
MNLHNNMKKFLGYEIVTKQTKVDQFGNCYEAIAHNSEVNQIAEGWGATEAKAIAYIKGVIAHDLVVTFFLNLLYSKRFHPITQKFRCDTALLCGEFAERLVRTLAVIGL